MEKFRIVSDSSSDVTFLEGVDFVSVPLKIITAEREFCDDETLDIKDMVDFLASYKGRSSSSCPNPQDWLTAYEGAENIFCITITSSLSGSYNSAVIAKKVYEERYPGRRVFILDSLSAGPEMRLVIERAMRLYLEGKDFDEICSEASAYSKNTALFFLLKSMKNLANNGRVSRIAASAAGILGIRALGVASEKGELSMLDKCRGKENIFTNIVKRMKEYGYRGGEVRIAHCVNTEEAEYLKKLILKEFPKASIKIDSARALCSFYAEREGLLIGFEK